MGKTEGIFLNLQCNCHIVGSIIIKLINHRTISVQVALRRVRGLFSPVSTNNFISD